jgi:hypothetical protein
MGTSIAYASRIERHVRMGTMERKDRDRERNQEDLDEQMERDTRIRRDTQVRGSLGVPPAGERSEKRPMDSDEGIPEFDRMDDEDRTSER